MNDAQYSQPSAQSQPILTAVDLVMDYAAGRSKANVGHAPSGTMPAGAPGFGVPGMGLHTLALNHVNFALDPGESVAVMGPSGSGKSTLLHALAGILKPTAGSVRFRGMDLGAMRDAERTKLRRSAFGFVFQSGQLLPELPAVENIALPMMLAGAGYRQATDAAMLWLERLGLRTLAAQRPGEMSGGQMQRIAIARALTVRPAVVFADEPTGALDQTTGREVMTILMQAAHDNGSAVVVVTHDPNVASFCSRTVLMRDGTLSEDGATAQVPASAPAQTVPTTANEPASSIPVPASDQTAVSTDPTLAQASSILAPAPAQAVSVQLQTQPSAFESNPADPGRGWIGGER